MSVYINKSEENFKAIDILISSKLKAPVIHCAYYSSLQLIIHYYNLYCVSSNYPLPKDVLAEGSHNFYLNGIVSELKKLDSRNAIQFHKFFSNFKRKRTEADYSELEIIDSDLVSAKEKAEKVKRFLTHVDEYGKCQDIFVI